MQIVVEAGEDNMEDIQEGHNKIKQNENKSPASIQNKHSKSDSNVLDSNVPVIPVIPVIASQVSVITPIAGSQSTPTNVSEPAHSSW